MRGPHAAGRFHDVLLAALACLILLVLAANSSTAAPAIPDESVWYAIQFAGNDVGTCHVAVTNGPFEGKPALLQGADTHTGLTVLGFTVSTDVQSRMYSSPDGQTPIFESVKMDSGGVTTETTARFFPDHIAATLTSGGETTDKTVEIPPGVKVSAMDATDGVIGRPLKSGDVLKEIMFNPVTLTLDPATIRVLKTGVSAQDSLVGIVKGLTECAIETPQGDATVYQDADGTPIRVEMIAGLTMVREAPPGPGVTPPQAASPSPGTPGVAPGPAPAPVAPPNSPTDSTPPAEPIDFAIATSVNADGRPITAPRNCTLLVARIDDGSGARTVTIHGVEDPETADGDLDDVHADRSLEPYLADAVYLSVDNPDIRSTAARIVGSRTNLAQIVCAIHDWVHTDMTPVGTMGLPRAAISVLNDPRGVCRDYATLYAALARAAGVPTRLCGGIVADHGRFYYHAWAESYIGPRGGWVPVDPMVPGRFVDATHIAIKRGDPSTMYEVTGSVGILKVTVLQTAY